MLNFKAIFSRLHKQHGGEFTAIRLAGNFTILQTKSNCVVIFVSFGQGGHAFARAYYVAVVKR